MATSSVLIASPYLLDEGRAIASPVPGQQVFSQWSLTPSQPVLDVQAETNPVTP